MSLKIPNSVKNLYFCGDLHWAPNILKQYIKFYNIINSCIICCGDFGVGFTPEIEKQELKLLNKYCKTKNVYIVAFAGNHDDNSYFTDTKLVNNKYIYLIPTYSITKVLDKNILNISGGISIDRMIRKNYDTVNIIKYIKCNNCNYKTAEINASKTYWETEPVIYKPIVAEPIDIICSHSAPSFCFPIDKGEIVYKYAQYDQELLTDIEKERSILDKVYTDYKNTITHWYYGHFHQSHTEIINNICFKLLNINEVCKYYATSDNNNIL